jgi:hypothetical protein
MAALFNTLRRRVQRAVDRRFDRARYDAEAVVVAFTARLRRTVDLDAIRGDLVQRRPRGVPGRPCVGMAPRPGVTEPAGSKEIGHDE